MITTWTLGFCLFVIYFLFKVFIDVIAITKCIFILRRRSRSRRKIFTMNGYEDVETWPFISIIKPIMTDNEKMKRIIESYYHIDYPRYEIHFCFQNPNNTCITFIKQISFKYPGVKTYVHSNFPLNEYGNNKIINISQGYSNVNGEYVWIVDENVQCQITVLKELITQFDDKDVALVHQVPLIKGYDSLESAINLTYFSTHHTRFVYFCDVLGIICLAGMSMMYDKEKLNEIGGPKSFVKFLSEDYHLANALINRGYKVKLSSSPAIQDCNDCSVGVFSERMVRWTKLRFNICFMFTLLEPFIHPLFISLTSAILLSSLFNFSFILVFVIYLIGNFLVDQFYINLIHAMFPEQGELQSFSIRIQSYFILQIILIPYIFILSMRKMKMIIWRGMSYQLTSKTIICLDNVENKRTSLLNKRFKRFKELQSIDENENSFYSEFQNLLSKSFRMEKNDNQITMSDHERLLILDEPEIIR